MGNKDGMAKNLQVIKEQWNDYMVEVEEVIKPGVEDAEGIGEKLHKLSAYGEEWFDKMPRINWYWTVVKFLVIYPGIIVWLI